MHYDLAAEKALALTLVATPAAYDYAADLEPEMFSGGLGAGVYAAVRKLLMHAQPVTPVTVQAEMVAANAGTTVPNWTGKGVTLEEVPALAARIRELWSRRELEALGGRLASAIERPSSDTLRDLHDTTTKLQSGKSSAKSLLALTIEWIEELKKDAERGPESRVSFDTGFRTLDKYVGGLHPGVLAILAARPGQGKSSFVMAIVSHLARTGVPVGLFWLEDDWRDAIRRYYQRRHGIEARVLRREPQKALAAVNAAAGKCMDELERVFVDDSHGLTANDIAARMRRMSREHGVRVFVADHLGEMQIEREDRWGDRHDLALGKAARLFRDTAKELNAVPLLVSQMNRQVEKRSDGVAKMSDLDGSGQIEQAARVIAFLSRPVDAKGDPTGDFFVDLAKNTYGETGRIAMRWMPETMTVFE